jgi:hypothetical protein
MNRRTLFSLIGFTMAAGLAQASILTYNITVDTSGIIAGPGFIELQFNQVNPATSGVGAATVTSFTPIGYALGGAAPPSTGVTGTFDSLPVMIPNDQGFANFYDEIVNSWGSSFSLAVNLDTAATNSAFYVLLLDSSFNPIVGPLTLGEVANLTIDSNGGITPQGSTFQGGFADIPEPSSAALLVPGLGALLLAFRKRRG